jgi:hypothetical protein
MLIALALSLIATAGGALVTYTYDEDAPLAARLCTGACIGFAALGLVGFIFASFLGLNSLTLALTGIVLAAPLLLLRDPKRRAQANADVDRGLQAISRATTHPDRWAFIYFFFYAAVAIVTWMVFSQAMLVKPDGISTGVLNNFGDLPFHISAITRFAYGQNFPPEDPTFSGVPFTYPFLTDFISAMFLRAGATLRDSMLIENYIVGVALVGVLHRFGQQLLRDRTAAILTPVLIILNGGFGWAMFLRDANKAEGGAFEVLKNIQHSYTILPDVNAGWRWGNAVTSLLVTQRGFLLGIPLAAIVFGQWWESLRSSDEGKNNDEVKSKKVKGKKQDQDNNSKIDSPVKSSSLFPISFFLLPPSRRMVAAGAIAGLLPLVHAHSFVVVMAMAGFLALINWRKWQDWAAFFVVTMVIAGPQLFWSTHHSAVSTGSFLGIEYGWGHGQEFIPWFWLKNTGLFIPLLIAALIWKRDNYLVSRKLLFFYLPFTLCFIVPNVVRMAPWIWDNVKVLFYWWIASAPIVALLLAHLWQGKAWNRVLAGALFVVLTLAGALDVFALVTGHGDYGEFDRDGVAFAEQIKQQTPPRAMILHAPIHNTPIFLTGRRSLMGYPGHIWTHGLAYGEREYEIKRIYAGAPDAPALLAKYGVDYVAIGPTEHAALKEINEAFFDRYRKVIESGGYRLYKVSP